MPDRGEVVRRYRSYLDACNLRAWEALQGYLAETVAIDPAPQARPSCEAQGAPMPTVW